MNMTPGIVVSLPTAERRRAMEFYATAFGWQPVGEPAEDGVPEPLQYRLDERTVLMLIPTGGFGWVLPGRDIAPPSVNECLLSLIVPTEQEVVDLIARMCEGGGQLVSESGRQPWGFSGVATDPDGHAWQITTPPIR